MLSRVFYINLKQLHVVPFRSLNILHSNEKLLLHRVIINKPSVKYFTSKPVNNTEKSNNLFKILKQNETENEDKKTDEQTYLRSLHDPDTFGSSKDDIYFEEPTDPGDIIEEQFIENPVNKSKKLSTKEYADMIKAHLSENRIKEAIDVLEIRMLKEDRVKPENYIFNLLIGGCARVGYSKKAFSLFNKMKQRGLKVTGGTYTSLFNACSTCPWPQDGLNKANHLRQIMLEKGYEPNATNYNAMIKAFGRCGEIRTAFLLVDEMKSKQLEIQVETFNFLLQACISDSEFGFRHALIVWHKMYQRRLLPDLYSFNLILRCVRDCGIGDIETMTQVISDILLGSKTNSGKQFKIDENQQLMIESDAGESLSMDSSKDESSLQETDDSTNAAPNLISRFPHLGSLVALNKITRPEDRLLLLGGASGVLSEMEKIKVTPNIKTFTALLDSIPPTNAAEHQIIQTIRKLKIKCDVDFFNILIKKRSMRLDYDGAKDVLKMIEIAALEPDIVTYGVLALGCQNVEEARELLAEMDDKGIRMNIQILGAMLKQGCYHYNFSYVIEIMRIVKNERLKPNEQFLEHLNQFYYRCFKMKQSNHKFFQNPKFQAGFEEFKVKLNNWKNFMGLNKMKLEEAVKVVEEHPWEQFQTAEATGMEDVKNPKLRRKEKLSRHINRLSPNKLNIEKEEHLLKKN